MSIFSKFQKGFQKGASVIQGAFNTISGRGRLDENTLLDIEEALYTSDFGVETTEEILNSIREAHRNDRELRAEGVGHIAREILRNTLEGSEGGDWLGKTTGKPDVLCLIGVNGSGKTTTALTVAQLEKSHSGRILFEGKDVVGSSKMELRNLREDIQFIFQDPYSSLNPRLRAEDIVAEPLISLEGLRKQDIGERIEELFQSVGLRSEQRRLFPHQFSGGQRQRLGIARAISTQPKLVICDEPVSALDVAVQAQILNLLTDLQKKFELTYLFISHDLGVIQHMCDSIAVMLDGKIVEYSDRINLFERPKNDYTKKLLSAVPKLDLE